jgi:hypothetical protein
MIGRHVIANDLDHSWTTRRSRRAVSRRLATVEAGGVRLLTCGDANRDDPGVNRATNGSSTADRQAVFGPSSHDQW